MKFLKESNSINSDLIKILKDNEFQDHLNDNDFKWCYDKISGKENLWTEIVRDFTELLLKAGINPLDRMKTIPFYFLFGSDIKTFTIPDSVTKIGLFAFMNCIELTSINIPDSVTEIGSGAFQNCTRLTSINIPDSVTEIGGAAFWGCKNLTNVEISNNVKYIWDDAFDRNTHIKYHGTKEEWLTAINHKRWIPIANITFLE